MKKPKGFEEYLGEYGVSFYDGYCGEPISWGFKILKHLGDEKWSEISKYGGLECNHGYPSTWYLITKNLTPQEAIEKYGKPTEYITGPKGGFRSITFGKKKFMSKSMYFDDILTYIKPTIENY